MTQSVFSFYCSAPISLNPLKWPKTRTISNLFFFFLEMIRGIRTSDIKYECQPLAYSVIQVFLIWFLLPSKRSAFFPSKLFASATLQQVPDARMLLAPQWCTILSKISQEIVYGIWLKTCCLLLHMLIQIYSGSLSAVFHALHQKLTQKM